MSFLRYYSFAKKIKRECELKIINLYPAAVRKQVVPYWKTYLVKTEAKKRRQNLVLYLKFTAKFLFKVKFLTFLRYKWLRCIRNVYKYTFKKNHFLNFLYSHYLVLALKKYKTWLSLKTSNKVFNFELLLFNFFSLLKQKPKLFKFLRVKTASSKNTQFSNYVTLYKPDVPSDSNFWSSEYQQEIFSEKEWDYSKHRVLHALLQMRRLREKNYYIKSRLSAAYRYTWGVRMGNSNYISNTESKFEILLGKLNNLLLLDDVQYKKLYHLYCLKNKGNDITFNSYFKDFAKFKECFKTYIWTRRLKLTYKYMQWKAFLKAERLQSKVLGKYTIARNPYPMVYKKKRRFFCSLPSTGALRFLSNQCLYTNWNFVKTYLKVRKENGWQVAMCRLLAFLPDYLGLLFAKKLGFRRFQYAWRNSRVFNINSAVRFKLPRFIFSNYSDSQYKYLLSLVSKIKLSKKPWIERYELKWVLKVYCTIISSGRKFFSCDTIRSMKANKASEKFRLSSYFKWKRGFGFKTITCPVANETIELNTKSSNNYVLKKIRINQNIFSTEGSKSIFLFNIFFKVLLFWLLFFFDYYFFFFCKTLVILWSTFFILNIQGFSFREYLTIPRFVLHFYFFKVKSYTDLARYAFNYRFHKSRVIGAHSLFTHVNEELQTRSHEFFIPVIEQKKVELNYTLEKTKFDDEFFGVAYHDLLDVTAKNSDAIAVSDNVIGTRFSLTSFFKNVRRRRRRRRGLLFRSEYRPWLAGKIDKFDDTKLASIFIVKYFLPH